MKGLMLMLIAATAIVMSNCTPHTAGSTPTPYPSLTPTPIATKTPVAVKKPYRLGAGQAPVILQFICNQNNTANPQLYTCVFSTPTPAPT